jgi:hypothetical protein
MLSYTGKQVVTVACRGRWQRPSFVMVAAVSWTPETVAAVSLWRRARSGEKIVRVVVAVPSSFVLRFWAYPIWRIGYVFDQGGSRRGSVLIPMLYDFSEYRTAVARDNDY